MSRVLVLSGGTSSERSVSLRSGAAVRAALTEAGHDTLTYDPAAGIEGILPLLSEVDVVFPALHGSGGEDGNLQAWLESQGVRFVGSGSAASRLCFNKIAYKATLQRLGLPTPAGHAVTAEALRSDPLTRQPHVLKPFDGGSSLDTFIVRDPTNAPTTAITDAFTRHSQLLLEELIDGIEITVGVLGDKALPVIEIAPPAGAEFDYDNKYNGATAELCPPEHVTDELQQQARDLALTIHQACECRDFSRTDMIIDRANRLWILETNTIPGMTMQSLLPKAAAVAGYAMPQLVDQLVQVA